MSTQELGLLTELDAVNLMLAAIGEAPVNSIDDTGLVDAVVARNTLRNTSRQVQNRGYHWNSVDKFFLSPSLVDPVGSITAPLNTLKLWTVDVDAAKDVVLRGSTLFDRENATNIFTEGVYVAYVTLLSFEELPSPARDYIALRAAEQFQQDRVGSAQLSQFHTMRKREAWQDLRKQETQTRKINVLYGSWSMARMFQNRR